MVGLNRGGAEWLCGNARAGGNGLEFQAERFLKQKANGRKGGQSVMNGEVGRLAALTRLPTGLADQA